MKLRSFCRLLGLAILVRISALTASALEPVTFHAGWFPSPQLAGIYVALERGYYREAGLDVRIEPFAFGVKSTARMTAAPEVCALGSIEGYIFLQQRRAGDDLKALAAMLQESPAGYMSLTSTGITRASDLAGKRVGVHRFAESIYAWVLARAGLAPDAAHMSVVHDDVTLLTRGELDAMQGYATEEFVRLQALTHDRSQFLSFASVGFSSYAEILYTTAEQTRRHPETLRAFLAATRRGWAEAFAQPERTVDIIAKHLGAEADKAHLKRALEALRPYVETDGRPAMAPMTNTRWQSLQTTAVDIGLIKQTEPAETFLLNW